MSRRVKPCEPLNKVETVNPSHAKVMEISKKEVTSEQVNTFSGIYYV